jgi:hypothetical protein
MELNGIHQLLAYVVNVNIVGGNKYTVMKETKSLLEISMEASLEENTEEGAKENVWS